MLALNAASENNATGNRGRGRQELARNKRHQAIGAMQSLSAINP
jgi:hypothetical protein